MHRITGLKNSLRVAEKYACILPGLPSFYRKIRLSEVKRRRTDLLKIKLQARIFPMDVRTRRIGKRNQSASI